MEESGLIQPVREEKGISIAFPECGKLVPPVIALTGFYLILTLFFYCFCKNTNANIRMHAYTNGHRHGHSIRHINRHTEISTDTHRHTQVHTDTHRHRLSCLYIYVYIFVQTI